MAALPPTSRVWIGARRTIRKLNHGRRLFVICRSLVVGLRRRLPSRLYGRAGAHWAVAAAVLTFLVLGACADTFRGLGPTPAVAESHANELFEAIAARFNRVEL